MSLRLISPFPDSAWADVWQWIQPFRWRVHDDFSPTTEAAFIEWMQRRTEGNLTIGVTREGQLGGLIWFERGNGVAGVMHVVFSKAFWGANTSMPALATAIRAYFLITQARKLTTSFYSHNDAIRVVSKDLGFTREARLRSHTLQSGEPVDLETWGILREEFFSADTTGDNRRSLAP